MAAPKFNLTKYDEKIATGPGSGINIFGKPKKDFPGEGGSVLKLQFPVRVKQDGKKNRWTLLYDTMEYEPAYLYKGGSPRTVTIETTYIVGGPMTGGIKWDVDRVATEIRRWKSYFYIAGPSQAILPIFQMDLYEHIGGSDAGTFRGLGVSIKHGKELIKGSDGKIFPLRSDVTLNVELVTEIEFNAEDLLYNYTGQGMEAFTNMWY